MKKLILAFLFAVVIVSWSACTKIESSNLIGIWLSETETTAERTVTYTFDSNTMTISFDHHNDHPFQDVWNYSLANREITLTSIMETGTMPRKAVLFISKLDNTSMCLIPEDKENVEIKLKRLK